MEKRKIIWLYVPISTLIKAAENKSNVPIHLSYDELMDQILDDSSSTSSSSVKNIVTSLFGGDNNEEERMTAIKCRFSQSLLRQLVESKNGYNDSITWKDALLLALDKNFYSLDIPASSEEEDEEDIEEEEVDENEGESTT